MKAEKNTDLLSGLGKRIKSARLAKGMTQKELAEGIVTRNMLSSIENGNSLPSLQTLCAFSDRLGIPAGALLSDLSEYMTFRSYEKAKAFMDCGKFKEAVDIFQKNAFPQNKSEMLMLEAKARTAYGEILCMKNKRRDAEKQFTLALAAAEKSGLPCGEIEDKIFTLRLFGRIKKSDQQQNSDNVFDSTEIKLEKMIFGRNEKEIYLWIREKITPYSKLAASMPSDKAVAVANELKSIVYYLPDGIIKTHLSAKIMMALTDFLGAKSLLVSLTRLDVPPEPALLYDIYTDIEHCSKCCGDFENAYKYKSLQAELAENSE